MHLVKLNVFINALNPRIYSFDPNYIVLEAWKHCKKNFDFV